MALRVRLSDALLALVLDRLSRFYSYLGRLELQCSDPELSLVALFKQFLSQIEGGLAAKVLSRMVQRAGGRSREDALVRALLLAASQLDTLLLGTQVFPRERPFLQTYVFVEEAFPFVPRLRERLAIILWPVYNFAEQDFRQSLEEALKPGLEPPDSSTIDRQITLYLTEAEFGNPSIWAILGHEVGHAIEEQHKLGEGAWKSIKFRAVPSTYWESAYVMEWIKELLADEIALRVLGPAYFCAFAFLSLAESSLLGLYSTHPPSWNRIERLFALLPSDTKDETTCGYYDLVRLRLAYDKRRGIDEIQLQSITWDKIYDAVSRQVDRALQETAFTPPAQYWRAGVTLATTLASGVPISAAPPANLNDIHQKMVELQRRSSSRRPQLKHPELARELECLKQSYKEPPNHPLAVLSSAWVERFASIPLRCRELLRHLPSFSDQDAWATVVRDEIQSWSDGLTYHDSLVLKSLEISSYLSHTGPHDS